MRDLQRGWTWSVGTQNPFPSPSRVPSVLWVGDLNTTFLRLPCNKDTDSAFGIYLDGLLWDLDGRSSQGSFS